MECVLIFRAAFSTCTHSLLQRNKAEKDRGERERLDAHSLTYAFVFQSTSPEDIQVLSFPQLEFSDYVSLSFVSYSFGLTDDMVEFLNQRNTFKGIIGGWGWKINTWSHNTLATKLIHTYRETLTAARMTAA